MRRGVHLGVKCDFLHFIRSASVASSAIATLMKSYEKGAEGVATVPKESPFYVRLDGSCFGNLVKSRPSFSLPWDNRFHNAMVLTARDVLIKFRPESVYTCSDELTLSFVPPQEISTHPYGGRIQKIITSTAGFTSARFNYHLNRQDYSKQPEILRKIEGMTQFFDSRVGIVPQVETLFENIRWRQSDCTRNSKTIMGFVYLPKKSLHKVPANKVIERVKAEHGEDWADQPDWYKRGILLKRIQAPKTVLNPHKGEMVTVHRGKIIDASYLLDNSLDSSIDDFLATMLPPIDKDGNPVSMCLIDEDYTFPKAPWQP